MAILVPIAVLLAVSSVIGWISFLTERDMSKFWKQAHDDYQNIASDRLEKWTATYHALKAANEKLKRIESEFRQEKPQ